MATFEHCRRVAAWASELALALGFSSDQRRELERAALKHHCPLLVLNDNSRARLLQDVRMLETNAGDWLPPPTRGILRSYHGMPAASAQPEAARLAAILEMANALDEHFESQPFDTGEAEPLAEAALGCLQITRALSCGTSSIGFPCFRRLGNRLCACCSRRTGTAPIWRRSQLLIRCWLLT